MLHSEKHIQHEVPEYGQGVVRRAEKRVGHRMIAMVNRNGVVVFVRSTQVGPLTAEGWLLIAKHRTEEPGVPRLRVLLHDPAQNPVKTQAQLKALITWNEDRAAARAQQVQESFEGEDDLGREARAAASKLDAYDLQLDASKAVFHRSGGYYTVECGITKQLADTIEQRRQRHVVEMHLQSLKNPRKAAAAEQAQAAATAGQAAVQTFVRSVGQFLPGAGQAEAGAASAAPTEKGKGK